MNQKVSTVDLTELPRSKTVPVTIAATNMEKTMTKCDGGDDNEHAGEVKKYSVVHKHSGWDYGTFNYCETCAAEDISRGFEVKLTDK